MTRGLRVEGGQAVGRGVPVWNHDQFVLPLLVLV